jgi:hypothetical protein
MSIYSNKFPRMPLNTHTAFMAAERTIDSGPHLHTEAKCRYLSAFLREAVFQAWPGYRNIPRYLQPCKHPLLRMAEDLCATFPPPPTLDQACKANLNDPVGRQVVRSFLLSLKEKEQS